MGLHLGLALLEHYEVLHYIMFSTVMPGGNRSQQTHPGCSSFVAAEFRQEDATASIMLVSPELQQEGGIGGMITVSPEVTNTNRSVMVDAILASTDGILSEGRRKTPEESCFDVLEEVLHYRTFS